LLVICLSHVFFSSRVWYRAFLWLGYVLVLPRNLVCLIEGFGVLVGREKIMRDFFIGLTFGYVVHMEDL